MSEHKKDADCITARMVNNQSLALIDSVSWSCPTCGVYHGDPCPCCGGRGFHELTCFEVLDAGKPIGN